MGRFKKVYIEITNVCNLSCDFCPPTKRQAHFMKPSFFEEILKEIKGFTDHVYFHVKGEPLLHPDLQLFLELCKTYGYHVNLTTNGTLIDNAKEKLLHQEALRQVNFSLHSFDANTKEETIDDYLEKIFSFAKAATLRSKVLISFRLWNLQENKKGVFVIENEEMKRNAHILRKIEECFHLSYKIDEVLQGGRGIEIAPQIFLNQASKFQWPDKEIEELSNTGFCQGLRDQIGILADGTVIPCCLDGEGIINLGNIKEKSFSQIIEGQRAKNLYNGFSKRQINEELCKKCDYRKRFGQ